MSPPLRVSQMAWPDLRVAAQQFDGRLRFSGATLACIIAFAFFAVLTSSLRQSTLGSRCDDRQRLVRVRYLRRIPRCAGQIDAETFCIEVNSMKASPSQL